MNAKTLLLGLVAAVVFAIGFVVVTQRKAEPIRAQEQASQTVPTPVAKISDPTPTTPPVEIPTVESVPLAKTDAIKSAAKPTEAARTEPPIMVNGYELQDPMARVALNLVGADPDAEAYWIGAINDSAMPAEERKDLIEDLNEDGLSNPRHPTAQDMPLIMARIRLIEQLMPHAIDDVNRDAFAEAYQDLVRLLNGQSPR